MRLIFLILTCILLAACQKQALEATSPIVGRWSLEGISTFGKGSTNYIGPFDHEDIYRTYDSLDLGKLTVSIEAQGILVFNSSSGEEKFRVIKTSPIQSVVYSQFYEPGPSHQVFGQELTIKSSIGKTFRFKYYYDPVRDRLIGVAWYKGALYNTADQPISNGKHFGFTFHSPSSTSEQLGVFYKI
jgi:hypothetical protein